MLARQKICQDYMAEYEAYLAKIKAEENNVANQPE
jgi:hypothetical protein